MSGIGSGNASIDFNVVASRPIVAGVVEPKYCQDCGRQFMRCADLPKEQRDNYCTNCRSARKPVRRVLPGFSRGNALKLFGARLAKRENSRTAGL